MNSQVGLLTVLLVTAVLCAPVTAAEWGKPLSTVYDGPEGKPRPVSPTSIELSADERSTISVFERATKSVVFIANTAIRPGYLVAQCHGSAARIWVWVCVEQAGPHRYQFSCHLWCACNQGDLGRSERTRGKAGRCRP
ncbi:MAG: hypothetical protein QM706_21565 [Nitrospira sp.]